jgi:hypothetical protein
MFGKWICIFIKILYNNTMFFWVPVTVLTWTNPTLYGGLRKVSKNIDELAENGINGCYLVCANMSANDSGFETVDFEILGTINSHITRANGIPNLVINSSFNQDVTSSRTSHSVVFA